MISILCAVMIGQANTGVKSTSKELSPKTRPAVELSIFKKIPCVTVSDYWQTDKRGTFHNRVFRFTYKADYAKELERWRKLFTKKDGWKYEQDEKGKDLIISQLVKGNPTIKEHAMILHPGKIEFDEKSPGRTKVLREKDWVWVSMNEMLIK